jgi:hypothetical protein
MTVARQLFVKHIHEVSQSTVGTLLLGSKSLGTFRSNGQITNNNRVTHTTSGDGDIYSVRLVVS